MESAPKKFKNSYHNLSQIKIRYLAASGHFISSIGALWPPFWSPWLPYWLCLDGFDQLWALLCSPWVPFWRNFDAIGHTFGSIRLLWVPSCLHWVPVWLHLDAFGSFYSLHCSILVSSCHDVLLILYPFRRYLLIVEGFGVGWGGGGNA